MEKRTQEITKLYKKHLNREPDDPGLMSYLHSDLSIDEIEHIIRNSKECNMLKRHKDFDKNVDAVGSSELFVMGSSPKTLEHFNALKKVGVKAILDLNEKESSFDQSWCDDYLNVPIKEKEPITTKQVDECFAFVRKNVIKEKRKVFIHSSQGISRAPAVMILFLVADKGLSFYNALRLVHSKQEGISPSRELISADVLEHVYKYREKYGTKSRDFSMGVKKPQSPFGTTEPRQGDAPSQKMHNPENTIIKVNNKLFAGFTVNDDILDDLDKMGIYTIVNLNPSLSTVSSIDSKFSNIHLPLFLDQMDSLMPVVLKSIDKYTKDGGLFIYCENQPLVKTILDAYIEHTTRFKKKVEKL